MVLYSLTSLGFWISQRHKDCIALGNFLKLLYLFLCLSNPLFSLLYNLSRSPSNALPITVPCCPSCRHLGDTRFGLALNSLKSLKVSTWVWSKPKTLIISAQLIQVFFPAPHLCFRRPDQLAYNFWAWTSNKFERKAPWTNQLILYGIFGLELWWFSKQLAHFSQVAAAQKALNINYVEVCLLQMISEMKQIMVLVKLPKFLHLHMYWLAKFCWERHRGSWVSSSFAFLWSTLMSTPQTPLRNMSQWISCSISSISSVVLCSSCIISMSCFEST